MTEIIKKLVVVGSVNTGKSSLILVISNKCIPEEYHPFVLMDNFFDTYVKENKVTLRIRDMPGDEDKYWLRPMSYSNTDVVLMCFSIGNPTSLEKIPEMWIPELQEHCSTVPIVLVGNKRDLRTDETTIYELATRGQEPVKVDDGYAMAKRIGAYAYIECSAELNEDVREVFQTAAHAAMPKKKILCCVVI